MLLFQKLVTTVIFALLSSVHAGGTRRRHKKSRPTITEIAVTASGGLDDFDGNMKDYDILVKAVVTAELDGALADPEAELTVFAPNDRAFYKLAMDLGYRGKYDEEMIWGFLVEALTTLGEGDPIPVLTNVLLYHVAPGKISARSLRYKAYRSKPITTLLDGVDFTPKGWKLKLKDKEPKLPDPRVTSPKNLYAKNGIIHTIDRVLIPVQIIS